MQAFTELPYSCNKHAFYVAHQMFLLVKHYVRAEYGVHCRGYCFELFLKGYLVTTELLHQVLISMVPCWEATASAVAVNVQESHIIFSVG